MLMAVKLLSDRFGMTTEGAQSTVDLQDARQMLEDGDLVVTDQVLNAYVIRSLQKRLNAFQGQAEAASSGSPSKESEPKVSAASA
jgi:methylphosphotriester-DNA--protein-cysteine methyltransferase